jgi:hypothetical protein
MKESKSGGKVHCRLALRFYTIRFLFDTVVSATIVGSEKRTEVDWAGEEAYVI